MPHPRTARPRPRPLSPRDQARLDMLCEQIVVAAARLAAAYREKRRRDLGAPD